MSFRIRFALFFVAALVLAAGALLFASRRLGPPRPPASVESGCASAPCAPEQPPAPSAAFGVLRGTVLVGPVCPVERIPPDPACAPRGYATVVAAARLSDSFATSTMSDARGSFFFALPTGEYRLSAGAGANALPRCEPVTLIVKAGESVSAAILCDSGIR